MNLTGHLTASGKISGSSTSTLTIGGALTAGAGTLTAITSTGNSTLGNASADTHTFTGHITASGNYSGSFTTTSSFGKGTYVGHVGIGTKLPTALLHISGTDKRYIKIDKAGQLIRRGSTGGWALYNRFLGSSDTDHGGFFAHGNADALSKFGIGPAYNNEYSFFIVSGSGVYKVGIGTSNPTTELQVEGNISSSGYISAQSHITSSGNISSSGKIYAEHLYSSDDAEITDNLTIGGSISNVTTTHITASGNISASGIFYAQTASFDSLAFENLDASGILTVGSSKTLRVSGSQYSGSGAQQHLVSITVTGSIIPEGSGSWDLGSQTNPFRDLWVTSESINFINPRTKQIITKLNAENVSDLKAGRSIREITELEAKTFDTYEGRKISRKFENRFNRWAPNIEFAEGEADYNEEDEVPLSYIDLTDKEFGLFIQGGRTQIQANLTGINISSSYSNNNKVNIKSPNITLSSGKAGVESNVVISGSLTVTGSSTFTNWGNFRNRFHKDKFAFEVSTNPYAAGGFREGLTVPTPALTGSAPHLHFILSGSGQTGIGLLNPKHTLQVSESSANWNALRVEGRSEFHGFTSAPSGSDMLGNPTTITNNSVVPAGYKAVLWTDNTDKDITIASGVSYTISSGANVKMINMDNLILHYGGGTDG